jgi:uncharacterized OB-fold protein
MPDDAPPVISADERLMVHQCTQCALWVSPAAADCPDCGGALVAKPVSGRGTVYTYTVNHQPFNPAVPVPYVIAIVALDEQDDLRVAANIVDCEPDSVYVGLPVAVRFERDVVDDSVVVPVFAPRT